MNFKKHTFRGLTLMEALLFLGLAAVVIVGAFTLYNNASSSSRMNEARTQLQTFIGGVQSLYSTSIDYSTVTTDLVISANIAPPSAVDDSVAPPILINPWGGTTVIQDANAAGLGTAREFTVAFNNIPDEACTAMLSSGLIDQGTVVGISANGNAEHTDEVTPDVAIAECNAGASANTVTFRAR